MTRSAGDGPARPSPADRPSYTDVLNLIVANTSVLSVPALSQTMNELIITGMIPSGTRLPTIRDLADRLHTGKSTIAAVWTRLADDGLIVTHGKSGTIVRPRPDYPRARRYTTMMDLSATGDHIDLGNLACAHLPDALIRDAVNAAFDDPQFNSVVPTAATDALAAACAASWPWPDASFLACQGLPDALYAALSCFVSRGDTVLVQTPAIPRILDILDSMRVGVVPFDAADTIGSIKRIRRDMCRQPAAMVLQPRNAVPTGLTVGTAWMREIAGIIRHKLRVIEIDQTPFCSVPPASFGTLLPGQVVRIAGFSLAYGHDLPVSVIGSDAESIQRLSHSRSFSSRWVSRLLQNAAAHLLTDPRSRQATTRLTDDLERCARDMRALLRARRIAIPDSTALQLWVPTEDETVSTQRMLDEGYIVFPGRYFTLDVHGGASGGSRPAAGRAGHLYLNPWPVRDHMDRAADAIARAVSC